jgi:hypothetical protein
MFGFRSDSSTLYSLRDNPGPVSGGRQPGVALRQPGYGPPAWDEEQRHRQPTAGRRGNGPGPGGDLRVAGYDSEEQASK